MAPGMSVLMWVKVRSEQTTFDSWTPVGRVRALLNDLVYSAAALAQMHWVCFATSLIRPRRVSRAGCFAPCDSVDVAATACVLSPEAYGIHAKRPEERMFPSQQDHISDLLCVIALNRCIVVTISSLNIHRTRLLLSGKSGFLRGPGSAREMVRKCVGGEPDSHVPMQNGLALARYLLDLVESFPKLIREDLRGQEELSDVAAFSAGPSPHEDCLAEGSLSMTCVVDCLNRKSQVITTRGSPGVLWHGRLGTRLSQ